VSGSFPGSINSFCGTCNTSDPTIKFCGSKYLFFNLAI
jgi:hypothetical protein